MASDVELRQGRPEDGPALMAAIEQINRETEFLGVPGEGHPWDGRSAEELRLLERRDAGAVFLAIDGRQIVGYLSAFRGWFERNRGNVFVAVVGLREAYRGRGIGTRLFEAIEDWARARGCWRLDLRVSSLNERGLALYRKRGFDIEGRIRGGVFRRGRWTDDFWMGKLLGPDDGASGAAVEPATRPSGRHGVGTLVIRPLRPSDAPMFRAWELRIAGSPDMLKLPGEVASEREIERDIATPASDPRQWLVAVQPDMYGPEAIIGLATATIERRFRMNHDAFINVVVLPEWCGQGLGRRLHRQVEDWAARQGVRRLTAAVQVTNGAGRAFAASLGYDLEVTMRSYARMVGGRLVDRLRLGKLLAD
jgi:RimJ/RimL family protein N-acetyltransferase